MEVTFLQSPEGMGSAAFWGWPIAVDLFCGGLAGGLLAIEGTRRALGKPGSVRPPAIAFLLLCIAGLSLFFDVSRKIGLWAFYAAFVPSSPMSWGAWILLALFPASFLFLGGILRKNERLIRAAGAASAILGLGAAMYTGFLMSVLQARPAWHTPLLVPVFIGSAIATALALLAVMEGGYGVAFRVALVSETLFLVAYLMTHPAAPASLWYAAAFGGLLPALLPRRIGIVLVLGGAVALRFLILAASQLPPLNLQ
ncbi:MAG TPA: NrfD/PsrC family molybdoenzyme membrane anchor subunit [Bryobacteraceae bacterium]|nr:NrfD/PsrC family molybdoenzyme membrane anchor subunit [Bryobacteraceae bacterium]